MFKISEKIRRLSVEEKIQYKEDGYLTGLPVFSSDAIDDLNNFFVSLSEKVDKSIDIGVGVGIGDGIGINIDCFNNSKLF